MIIFHPHPSSKNPHFQNEARCTTFLVKMNFICMRMKIHLHIKGWAPTLVLQQRRGELRNGLLNLFQEIESVIHWPDGYTDMLIGLSPWTCWYIFHILMIPNKDAPGSRDRCLPHYPPQCLRVCAEQLSGSRLLSANARVIWLCACVRNWPGRGLVYVCQLLLRLV